MVLTGQVEIEVRRVLWKPIEIWQWLELLALETESPVGLHHQA